MKLSNLQQSQEVNDIRGASSNSLILWCPQCSRILYSLRN